MRSRTRAARARVVLFAALTLPLAPLQIKTGFDEGKELVVTVLKVSVLRCASVTSATWEPDAPCQTGHGRGGHPRCEGGCQVGASRGVLPGWRTCLGNILPCLALLAPTCFVGDAHLSRAAVQCARPLFVLCIHTRHTTLVCHARPRAAVCCRSRLPRYLAPHFFTKSGKQSANAAFGCLLSLCSFSFASEEVQMNGWRQILHCEVTGARRLSEFTRQAPLATGGLPRPAGAGRDMHNISRAHLQRERSRVLLQLAACSRHEARVRCRQAEAARPRLASASSGV